MRGRPSFHLFGIPVRVDPFFLVVIFVLGTSWLTAGPEFLVSWMLIASSSVLLHEMGHALAFRAFGIRPSIALVGLGGLTSGEGRIGPGRSIVVSLAGPLATLVLVGVPALVYQSANPRTTTLATAGTAHVILEQIVFVNVLWALLNLAPVLPLDGGQVVASLLELGFRERGRQIAVGLSIAIGGVLLVLGLTQQQFVLTFIGGLVVAMNAGQLFHREPDRPVSGIDEAHHVLVQGHPHLAERMLVESLQGRLDVEQRTRALELLAWTRLLTGDTFGAQQAMASLTGPQSQLLHGAMAMTSGRIDEGVALLTWAFVHEPPSATKLLAAIAVSRAGQTSRVAGELSLLGPAGQEALRVLGELLAYVGLVADAQQVSMIASRTGPAASGY